jgi:hypothetical protein
MRYRLNLSFGLLFLAVSAGGQTQPCELDIPLNIVMPDLALVRNMHQDGFIAHRGSEVLPIRSVNEDTASRRIVVVVENGKNVNPGARKVEVSILGAIVKNARAEDSFALLTAIGPRRELPFGAPRETLLSAIAELSSPAKGNGQAKSVLDAVLEAAGSLQPAQRAIPLFFLLWALSSAMQRMVEWAKRLWLRGSGSSVSNSEESTLVSTAWASLPAPVGFCHPEPRLTPTDRQCSTSPAKRAGFSLEKTLKAILNEAIS